MCADKRDLKRDLMWEGFPPQIFCLGPHTQTADTQCVSDGSVCSPRQASAELSFDEIQCFFTSSA